MLLLLIRDWLVQINNRLIVYGNSENPDDNDLPMFILYKDG